MNDLIVKIPLNQVDGIVDSLRAAIDYLSYVDDFYGLSNLRQLIRLIEGSTDELEESLSE